MNYQKALAIRTETGWWRSRDWGTYAVGSNDRKRERKAFKKRYRRGIRVFKRESGVPRLTPGTLGALRAYAKIMD